EINECITYADALRARIDARVVVKAVAREEVNIARLEACARRHLGYHS
ncbi:hypothetical protein Tco_0689054, partial [Tanacetum coccineum]